MATTTTTTEEEALINTEMDEWWGDDYAPADDDDGVTDEEELILDDSDGEQLDPETEIFMVCQEDDVPLERLRLLVDKNPSLLRIHDVDGNRPIFYLGQNRYIATDVLEYVAERSPDVLKLIPQAHALSTLVEAFANGCSLDLLKTLIAEVPALVQSDEWLGSDPLHETISRENAKDEAILYLAQSCPEAVERGNWEGRLPLHLAALHGCSLKVIRALTVQYPAALALPDVDGDLALHMSVSGGSARGRRFTKKFPSYDIDIVQYLVEQNPTALAQGNDEEQLPLHVACEAGCGLDCIELLCKASSEAAEQVCASGLYPLHCACGQKNYGDVIRYLADLYPDAAQHKDEDGDLPLHTLVRRDWPNAPADQLDAVNKLLSIYPAGIRTSNDEDDLPLHIVCEASQSLDLVKRLVSDDSGEEEEDDDDDDDEVSSIRWYGESGTLPLHRACTKRKKQLDVIEYILNLNTDAVTEEDDEGNLPLHFLMKGAWTYCHGKREALIQKMIDLYPESVHHGDENSMSPFNLALRWGAPATIINSLRGHCSPLHRAVSESVSLSTVARAISLYPSSVYERDEEGELPLHTACRVGAPLDVVKTLHKRNPTAISARDDKGNMPLHHACGTPTTDTLQFLISKFSAALRMPNFQGALPLHLVCSSSSPSFLAAVRLLVEGNADALKRPDENGRLPLHRYCARSNSSQVMLYLLNENQAACGMKDNNGNLPLHTAASNSTCYPMAIQHLTKKNRQALTLRNNNGYLPLHLYLMHRFRSQHDLSHVRCLAQRGFSKQSAEAQVSADGLSFLHIACSSHASLDVIQYLLDRDPDHAPKLRDSGGQLPLHLVQDYETAHAVFSTYPNAISAKDDQGNTPLHVACSFRRNLAVVRCLWVCDVEAATARNNNNDLPLHLACEARAEQDVIEFLVKRCPSSVRTRGHNDQLPLHAWFRIANVCCDCTEDIAGSRLMYLVTSYPNALQSRDGNGFAPVHLAAQWGLDFIYQLLLACPSAL